MATIGEVNEIGEMIIEWKIKNYFALSKKVNKKYYSQLFSFANASWYLSIWPNGEKRNSSEGFISLYLHRKCSGLPISMKFCLGFKFDDYIDPINEGTHDFKETDVGFGFPKIISRNELCENMNELPSSNIVTVICILNNSNPTGIIATGLDGAATLNAHKDNLSHLQKFADKPIKCTDCGDVFALMNISDHKCQITVTEANEKLLNDFEALMLSGDHSDVIIKVKGQEFRLHRNILASRNSFFSSMFKSNMKEKITGIVTIDDCEPDIFKSFIHLVYTGKIVKLSLENVCSLYEVADKYQEDQLKKECLHFMVNSMTVDTFCDFTAMALRHSDKALLNKGIKCFASNIKEVVRTVKWQTFLTDHPIQANELLVKALDLTVISK